MPFEVVMLLGFFGAALLGLLPEARAKEDENRARRRHAGHLGAVRSAPPPLGQQQREHRSGPGRKLNPRRGGSRAAV
jgi:hypothetical protein